ncbi:MULTISPECIES: TetR/AcrR family transcriptional regulator [Bacillus]|uniref:TetR/AcrR family transcriptional regulator n=1 Tax=Bacillus TaxID=1386 RepID=UPI0024536508|nr:MULTISPECIES: TetR/AcrR family transcriptional regulator [Bacillus]MDH3079964.1 TetR/AcrR family transcriptional regulator [Bacillus amyloliquefaciens]MDU0076832.1 TetR/AcrR family transcriptional regulator [Bacillus sp. IG2]MDU0103320.1 TetR/AcrR family transcriptional regulator [Bacillus sp. IS1]MEC2270457.1 TetR/AcrR family transcriptional regulator [Bacillus velezensis]MED3680154.1 TetR/AcrR family transcriptional regulator [Bacillus velezensis]
MARTKEFDEDAVLLKAVRLFWEQGYEKTSMTDLVNHMGVHKRSLYDTFGDKHSLYIKTLNRYTQLQSEKKINKENLTAVEAIRQLFDRVITRGEGEYPKGCLIVNTAVELALHDSECKDWVDQRLTDTERLIRELIEAGQQSGELDKMLNAELLSQYINNALIGLRVMIKTTDNRDKLEQIVDTTLSILKK